jgi:hypothetical protein
LEKLPIKTAKILTENQTLADMSLSLTELIFDPEIDIANHNTLKKLNLQNPSQETKDFLTKHQIYPLKNGVTPTFILSYIDNVDITDVLKREFGYSDINFYIGMLKFMSKVFLSCT